MPAQMLENAPPDNTMAQFLQLGQFLSGMKTRELENENLKQQIAFNMAKLDAFNQDKDLRHLTAVAEKDTAEANATRAKTESLFAPMKAVAELNRSQADVTQSNAAAKLSGVQADMFSQQLKENMDDAPIKKQLREHFLASSKLDLSEKAAGSGMAAILKQEAQTKADNAVLQNQFLTVQKNMLDLTYDSTKAAANVKLKSELMQALKDPAMRAAARENPNFLNNPDLQKALEAVPENQWYNAKDWEEYALQQKALGNAEPYKDVIRAKLAPILAHAASQMSIDPNTKQIISPGKQFEAMMNDEMKRADDEASAVRAKNAKSKAGTTSTIPSTSSVINAAKTGTSQAVFEVPSVGIDSVDRMMDHSKSNPKYVAMTLEQAQQMQGEARRSVEKLFTNNPLGITRVNKGEATSHWTEFNVAGDGNSWKFKPQEEKKIREAMDTYTGAVRTADSQGKMIPKDKRVVLPPEQVKAGADGIKQMMAARVYDPKATIAQNLAYQGLVHDIFFDDSGNFIPNPTKAQVEGLMVKMNNAPAGLLSDTQLSKLDKLEQFFDWK